MLRRESTVVRIGAARPANGPQHRVMGVLVRNRVRRAFIKGHENIAAESELDVDGGFGRELVRVAIEVGLEADAVFGDFAKFAEAEYLEAAGIGEDGSRPVHKLVQAAKLANGLVAGPQIKMIGVAEENANAEIVEQVALREAFDRGLGADGHKDGRRDGAVRRMENTDARARGGALVRDFEVDVTQD